MKNLNLHRTWEILNRISEAQDELAERSVYVHLLGARSSYNRTSYTDFLNYYNFSVDEHNLVVFNDDPIPWENYTVGNFSYLPLELLEASDSQIEKWIDKEVATQLEVQEKEKLREKENLEQQIAQLQKRLANL